MGAGDFSIAFKNATKFSAAEYRSGKLGLNYHAKQHSSSK
jgi:hypothetical protein